MKKFFRKVMTLGFALIVCIGAITLCGASEGGVAQAATTDYYSGITATSGTQLLGQLHDLITSTHKTYTSYDDCKNIAKVGETDPGPDGGVLEFYTQQSIYSFSGTVGTWNREHVWCQSLSNGLWGTSGGGSDMHHIRPSESKLNSNRGNKKYGVVSSHSSSNEEWSYNTSGGTVALGGYSSGNTFEPLDNVKGDVARIVMYVYTHYNTYSNVGGTTNGSKGGKFGTLNFTHIMSASNETAAQKLLLEWNRSDPVDDIERTRNKAAYGIQGNRNPFIDNENYADAIWGDGTTVDPPAVVLQSISLNVTTLALNVGKTYDLTVTPTPRNASASVNWTSSNQTVATVTAGKVVARSAGTAVITATSTTDPDIKATATVTVTQSTTPQPISGKATVTIDSFDSLAKSYAFQSWTADGIKGTAFIYGATADKMQFTNKQSSYYIASTTATSSPIRAVTVKTATGTADRDWLLLTSDTAYGEIPGGNPQNGNNHGVKTVTEQGTKWDVEGNDTYFALVYTSENKGAAYLDSVVIEYVSDSGTGDPTKPESLKIISSVLTLKEGESTVFATEFVPSTAEAEVVWSSSDPAVATVDPDGTVSAIAAGITTITATCKSDSSIEASVEVTVTATEPEPVGADAAKVKEFHDAVEAIGGDTLSKRLSSINAAIRVYNRLSDADKTAAADDIEALRTAIASYNQAVKAYNDAADAADKAALGGAARSL